MSIAGGLSSSALPHAARASGALTLRHRDKLIPDQLPLPFPPRPDVREAHLRRALLAAGPRLHLRIVPRHDHRLAVGDPAHVARLVTNGTALLRRGEPYDEVDELLLALPAGLVVGVVGVATE